MEKQNNSMCKCGHLKYGHHLFMTGSYGKCEIDGCDCGKFIMEKQKEEQDNIFWNDTLLGKKINKSIQELTQEYWESGFEVGKQFIIEQGRTQAISEFKEKLKEEIYKWEVKEKCKLNGRKTKYGRFRTMIDKTAQEMKA